MVSHVGKERTQLSRLERTDAFAVLIAFAQPTLEGSNMIFHSLTFARSRGKFLKPGAKPEVFDLPKGPCEC